MKIYYTFYSIIIRFPFPTHRLTKQNEKDSSDSIEFKQIPTQERGIFNQYTLPVSECVLCLCVLRVICT